MRTASVLKDSPQQFTFETTCVNDLWSHYVLSPKALTVEHLFVNGKLERRVPTRWSGFPIMLMLFKLNDVLRQCYREIVDREMK